MACVGQGQLLEEHGFCLLLIAPRCCCFDGIAGKEFGKAFCLWSVRPYWGAVDTSDVKSELAVQADNSFWAMVGSEQSGAFCRWGSDRLSVSMAYGVFHRVVAPIGVEDVNLKVWSGILLPAGSFLLPFCALRWQVPVSGRSMRKHWS